MTSHYILAFVLIFSYGFDCANSKPDSNEGSNQIKSLLNNYDKSVRPDFGGALLNVEVSMYVISFGAVSDIDMDYTIHFYFRQHWTDPRLSFDIFGLENINLGQNLVDLIWVPDTFFVNEKESDLHMITTKNEFIRINRNGTVTKSVRLSVKASCPMNFRNYPMDKQICSLHIESYGYNAYDMQFAWKKNGDAVGVATNLTTGSLFNLIGFTKNTELIDTSTGHYSRLRVDFEFMRTKGYYFIQIYIPCAMLVILAWVSFSLNHNASNYRLVFCSLALLLMVAKCEILNTQIPKTSVKAVDVFTGISLTFIFVALIECAYIFNSYTKNGKDDVDRLSKIDKYFFIGYPIAFFIFNILYWAISLSG